MRNRYHESANGDGHVYDTDWDAVLDRLDALDDEHDDDRRIGSHWFDEDGDP